jgi:hypothetical protein
LRNDHKEEKMKRRILGLTIAFVFMGFNLFAADGDLIVNGKLGVGTLTPPQDYGVDIISLNNGLIRGGSSEADTTTKTGRLVLRHYSNSQLPVYVVGSASTSTDNFIAIGGGNTLGNAATKLDFFTASNNTTPVGSSRITVLRKWECRHRKY